MANFGHLEILKQGTEVWNAWRKYNPSILPVIRTTNGSKPDLSGLNLSEADLSFTYLFNANLRKANLNKADLSFANLTRANLSYANLREANLQFAGLMLAKLGYANLKHSTLFYANLAHASLPYADLSDALLLNTNFNSVRLNYTNFTKAIFAFTNFSNTDLSTAKGLETVVHRAPSSIGIDTIYESKGKISEVFLHGIGISENFITYMHSLKAQDFYKCFISFTEADDMFSEQLYKDLQAKGVRCWRWKEDAKWGKTLMSSIDEAVQVYDKLVVICSKQSLNSPAVIREIERALQKEDDLARQGRDSEVLFPLRLDNYLFTEWKHHRKADIIAKNVGDFRHWKDHDSYQKAFDRLLRDLKAEKKPTKRQ